MPALRIGRVLKARGSYVTSNAGNVDNHVDIDIYLF